ncbi:grasp-with-spasm system ATP-grasp peptide maturase [Pedobacter riviphilus]|uniref:Grasp-with-spasm system ATP-grasp peptide maturase n=1 Tax=Pedobacter riviphilus TaxID=2766984 RepID=A0ABX6TF54_9SPHI|nr:grasp-with-spasm system ATP-grasp peptide maturase [Pedobacter riviphilus]QNR84097.1 grasp-with-spasm system ATP-grasp peptide maturase [Pedobacter riviphilus]
MILIISKKQETTTNEVIKWLWAMDKKFIRVHEDEVFEIKTKEKRIYIESQRNCFYIDEITSVWYRRGGLKFKNFQYDNVSVDIHMQEHQHWLQDYVIKTLEAKKHINKQSNSAVNKLLVLAQAKKVGLDVPEYYLAENTDEAVLDKTIIKPLTGNITINTYKDYAESIMYTSVIDHKEEESFFITFFQEKIEKDFEIRSFYLNGKFFSTAIMSQNDEQTKTDFRKYNLEKPNRNVRYNLPVEIEEKTHQLMMLLDVNCGSIDFMKSGEKFYFLEVNTVGQFLGVTSICNYAAEQAIAEYL